MTPIVHITDKEAALMRENERLTEALEKAYTCLDKSRNAVRIQDVSIELMTEQVTKLQAEIGELRAALKAQPVQEPVAWRCPNWSGSTDDYIYRDADDCAVNSKGEKCGEPLYLAAPVQPVQEPIAILHDDGYWTRINTPAGRAFADKRPLPPTKVYAAPVQPAQPAPLTDSQASTIARLIANRNAELCNVDPDDNWKIYGQDFIDEVRFFEAAVRTGGAG